MKTPAAKLPQVTAKMTRPQFCKFKTDWDVCKYITNLPISQLHAHLYNSCDDYVQTSLANSTSYFMTLSEDQLLTILRDLSKQFWCPGDSTKIFRGFTPWTPTKALLWTYSRALQHFKTPNCILQHSKTQSLFKNGH